jgi:ATP-binding cassette subfamily B protein
MSKMVTSLQSSFASAERVYAVLDKEPDVPEKPHAIPLLHCTGRVTFENVSYQYDERRPALRNVSFDVPPGTCVGIMGTTGSGKTTLLKLLTRLHDPTSGRILIDGVDIRDYRLADLRNQFAIVLQDSILFSTSIAENIAYARPEAAEADIIAAARAAHAHDFITRMTDRYQTPVGERGAELSGGERQRISIARAFLKGAPMLILDEPTSALDAGTEAIIGQTIQELMKHRTTFLVTHRPALVQNCDLILHLENGEIVKAAWTSPPLAAPLPL